MSELTAEVTALEDHKVRIDVSVPEEEVRARAGRATKALGQNLRMPGFRPGKAPIPMIVQAVGREAVIDRMLRDSISDWYTAALDVTGVIPVDEPEIDIDGELADDAPIAFTATVVRRPVATLGEYKGLEVERPPVDVTDEIIDAEIERLRSQVARLRTVERPAGDGDFVLIDFDGAIGDEPAPNTSARDYAVQLGSGRLIGGFEGHLVGVSAGETTTFDLAYPDDDTRGELKGQTITFTVEVKRVQELELPEVDDTFASEAAGFDTLADLRTDLHGRIETVLTAQAEEQFRRRAIDAAVVNATFDVPPVMIDNRVEAILHDTAHQLPRGVTLEDYVRSQGRTLAETRQDLRPDAEMSVRREIVVEAIIAAEAIEISDEELEAKVLADAAEAGRDPKDILKALRRSGNVELVRDDIARDRAIDVLVDSAVAITPEQAAAKEPDAEESAPTPKRASRAKKPTETES